MTVVEQATHRPRAGIALVFLILALGLAPTATLTPFVYLQSAFAAGIGWAVFGHVPDGWAWAGMAVVALCGGSSAWLNRLNRKDAAGLNARALR